MRNDMIKQNIITIMLGIGIFSFSSSIYAIDTHEYTCPKIKITQTASPIDEPWQIISDKKIHHSILERIGLFSGHPREMAELVPESNESKQKQISVWEFSQNEKIWLTCYYRDTKVIATRQLANKLTKCTLTAQRLSTNSEITGEPVQSTQKIICQ